PSLTHQYRTVVVSDVHLGTPDSRPERLLAFLGAIRCETLVLNGDLLDVLQMQRRRWRWSPAKSDLFRQLARLIAAGTRVIYVPGNHDECFRAMVGQTVAGVSLHREWRFALADGRQALILHGDEFDAAIAPSLPKRWLGDLGYDWLLRLDRLGRRLRGARWQGSLARAVKTRIPSAMAHVTRFEEAALDHARREGVEVIICGHIHHANLRRRDGVTYANSGDWVEGCSALVEHGDGTLDVIEWADNPAADPRIDPRVDPRAEPTDRAPCEVDTPMAAGS
ncbi:MAG TPA: UDP-2,3-diacylglucosamine diphosphatase, partial [Chromatiales bacterium]|nr:UDP-2,3-diacylglucosamine diphosphatase [Chromatiales bacterium]